MHPLHILTQEEVETATYVFSKALLLESRSSLEKLRWIEVCLEEPSNREDKQVLLRDHLARALRDFRQARVVVYDVPTNTTFEGVVCLSSKKMLEGPNRIPGVQPAMTAYEYELAEKLVRAYPPFQEALTRRGLHLGQICVDPWCPGYFSEADSPDRRLAKPLIYVREEKDDNLYARPLEGLAVLIDLSKEKIIEFADNKVIPIPGRDPMMNYVKPEEERKGLKPLHISQPDGPSFSLSDSNLLQWQGWSMRVGFTSREGVVIHSITYKDPDSDGEVRPVANRISVAEMVVPYGDPANPHYLKNAFDAGEDGLGRNAHSLSPDGCDCLGEISYLDATLVGTLDGRGEVLKNAICIHEEDSGLLWKHMDWRSGHTEVRRGRDLIVSFVCTVANYEYAFYYKFGMDAAIQLQVRLTGIVSTGALDTPEMQTGRVHGTVLSPGLYAPVHQHFFVARLDMAVDGLDNSVSEVEVYRSERDPETNPYNNAFGIREKVFHKENDAKRSLNNSKSRHWLVRSSTRTNRTGKPTAYALLPQTAASPMAWPDAEYLQRATFLKHHVWVTPFARNERYPAGDYPNQSSGGEGLAKWTSANRPIKDQDLVMWYSFGLTHIVRLEDWPIMPVDMVSFRLVPAGFFGRSPAIDVPPAERIPGQQQHREGLAAKL